MAYNAQAVVDHDSDLIVAVDVSGDETDHEQLVPMMQTVESTFGKVAEQTVADAGYASGVQFEQAEQRHLPVRVAVQQESDKGPYTKSRFTYDGERDEYVCPRGEMLAFERVEQPTTGKPQPIAKAVDGFRRFTVRGLQGVRAQMGVGVPGDQLAQAVARMEDATPFGSCLQLNPRATAASTIRAVNRGPP